MPRLRGILKSRKNLQGIGTSSFRVGRLLTAASFVWCMLKWIIWITWSMTSMTDLWSLVPRENDKETLQTVSDRFQWFQASVPLFRLWSSGKMLGTPESTCRLDRLTLTREKKKKLTRDNLRPGGQGLPKWLKLCWQSPQRKKDFVKDRFVGYCWKYLIWLESRSQHFNHTALISFPDAWSKAPGWTKKDRASESLHPFGIFASGGRAWQEELL